VGVAALAYAGDGRLTRANTPARELIGGECAIGSYPETWISALRARTASGIALPREDLPPLRALAGEAVRRSDVLVRVRGCDVLLEVLATPALDPKGRPRGAIVLLEDVTEQRRHEAALRGQGRGRSRPAVGPPRSSSATSEPRAEDQSICGGPSEAESNGA
jgi:PAS domain-containing protein